MGLIELDFQSIVVGYMVGVMLMWSLCNTLYGDNNDREQKRILNILGLAMIAGIICCTVIHLNECTPVQPCFDLPELLPVEQPEAPQ